MNSIKDIIDVWGDTPEQHRNIAEILHYKTDDFNILKELRDFVESNSYGHGERCFYAMWYLIFKELPKKCNVLEVGVFRGQSMALFNLIAQMQLKDDYVYGVSPMNGAGGFDLRINYTEDVEALYDRFKIPKKYYIFKGYSTEESIIFAVKNRGPFDAVFIDGGHDSETVMSDLKYYPPLLKTGGFLVIDDCCNNMNLPQGYFGGIWSVTTAVLEWEKTRTDFEFLFSVAHNKVYRKK